MEQAFMQLLDHRNNIIAKQIYGVFQRSYRIEADIIGVSDFPPLKRIAEDFVNSDSQFYGYWEKEKLAAVVEIIVDNKLLDICSLVVDPAFFRQGIASRMMQYLMAEFNFEKAVVETAAVNLPAIALYQKFGFSIIKKWTIDIGIEKVMLCYND